MNFAQQFPELNPHQLNMLIRVIEDEVIKPVTVNQPLTHDRLCAQLQHLIKPTKENQV